MRGIEREGLRIDRNGHLSSKPHPLALGSALTHPHITTDYSEALLELITGTHTTVESLLQELTEVHQFVMQQNRGESIWMQSMPAILPPEKDIPIATYGSSNTGMLKHVYRRGLAERYGKKMQCIAGLHPGLIRRLKADNASLTLDTSKSFPIPIHVENRSL